MKLCLLLTILSLIGLAWSWPTAVQELEPAQSLPQDLALAPEEDKGLVSLQDVADVGSEHANAGARNARFLWGGYWGRPWYGGYYYRYPRYHGYYNYWW